MKLRLLEVSNTIDVVVNKSNNWEIRNYRNGICVEFDCQNKSNVLHACDKAMIFDQDQIDKILEYFGHITNSIEDMYKGRQS